MLPTFQVLLTALYMTAALLSPGVSQPEELSYTGPLVLAQAEPVTEEYFADAAFIGNSLTDGLRMFSGLTTCDYYAATSKTIFTVDEYITQMSEKDYGKIYIFLGINEIGSNIDKLMTAYASVLDRLAADHPDTLIYVMGLSPVSAKKDAAGGSFTMANIRRFNERLFQLAEEKQCYYIDLCDALAGEDGFLPADKTWDGVHFNSSYYKVWLEYLQYHYIPTE